MGQPRVSVIVIGYNDERHFPRAVASALAQGPEVAEVIAVDDASTDATGPRLDRLAAREPRLRVLHRAINSGGCGTPRNDGLRAAAGPYVMFLDSDDLLPPGAVTALLAAADRYRAPVVAGAAVRRELPSGREVRWQPALFHHEAVYRAPDLSPRLVRDTLCVNKLYALPFLEEHRITFPEGRRHYEDFVFTARVLAAADRLAVIPDPVYLWLVRRSARTPSISLARGAIDNWRSRVAAHQSAVSVLLAAGAPRLARAAQAKFLDQDLRMYARELPRRAPEYQAQWWRLTAEYLADFDVETLSAAALPGRWLARLLRSAPLEYRPAPAEVERMAQLAGQPARLLPPYAQAPDGQPAWSEALPEALLDTVLSQPPHRLPLTVDARLLPGGRWLRLTVYELYGRLTAAGAHSLTLELRCRDTGRLDQLRRVALRAEEDWWTAEVPLDLYPLAALSRGRVGTWDVWAVVHCGAGRPARTTVRAAGSVTRRNAVPSRRHGLLLVQPYATAGGSLALRLAPGPRGLWAVTAGRARRLPTVGGRLAVRR